MKTLLAIIAMLGVTFFSCSRNENINTVYAEDFATAIKAPGAQLLDVRTENEFGYGHIAGAVNIDMQNPDFVKLVKAKFNIKKPILIYCHSGRRSLRAAFVLEKQGFRLVNLYGGMIAWEQAQLPTTRD